MNNLNSSEICRLNVKSFFNQRCAAFCYLGRERLAALSIICLFGCLAQLCLGVYLLCTDLS